ncbi:hypothetical protein BX666DRAFT_1922879 [Dichotomocladium elegans]|nr:hypothetical protein BX666DRAFT_1922879 [Dichotomocladium elegans]
MNQGQQAFIDVYSSQCCSSSKALSNRSQHLLETHIQDILKQLREAFSRHRHPALETRRSRYADPRLDSEHLENQTWKELNQGYDQVHVLEWIVNACPGDMLTNELSQLVPATLLIMDDYDMPFKIRGVKLVHEFIKKVDANVLVRSSIDNVYMETLFRCLNYLSQEQDIPLLDATYPCLLDLIDKTRMQGSKEHAELYERVMVHGVILGFETSGAKVGHLQALLQPVKRLYNGLGPLGIRYLKATLPSICDALGLYSQKTNMAALDALQGAIQVCWPRISQYKGIILKGIATSWENHYNDNVDPSNKELQGMLQKTLQIFLTFSRESAKADIDALLLVDKHVFGPLIGVY